jgi:hypothetical protein
MPDAAGVLPEWFAILWGILSSSSVILGILWISILFWPRFRDGHRMAIESIKIGRETAELLRTVKDELLATLKETNNVMKRINAVFPEGKEEDLKQSLANLEEHIKVIRDGVEKNTKPLPVLTRPPEGKDNGEGEENEATTPVRRSTETR